MKNNIKHKKQSFEITTVDNITGFTNHTDLDCFISLKPIAPKRKWTKVIFVRAGQFVILESHTDLSAIGITFEFDNPETS